MVGCKSESLVAADSGDAKVDGSKNASVTCCKRCEKKEENKIWRNLPPEMFLEILSHVPAAHLRYVVRRVCKEWNLIISTNYFIRRHLRNSTSGLLIERLDFKPAMPGSILEMRHGRLKIYELLFPLEGPIDNSCNGLVLWADDRNLMQFYVTNPLTKQRAVLPDNFGKNAPISTYSCALAFVEGTNEYKVVHIYVSMKPFDDKIRARALTVGVDKEWRSIHEFRSTETHTSALCVRAAVTGSYVHWIKSEAIVTLNMETETFTTFSLSGKIPSGLSNFLVLGNDLSVVCRRSKFWWDVWKIDWERGECGKLLISFNWKGSRRRIKWLLNRRTEMESLIPYGWLGEEVLVFSGDFAGGFCIAYNIRTAEIQWFDLGCWERSHGFHAHVASFAWLN